MPDAADSRYPIGFVTRRTGLSPDVLRIWERRYGAVTPSRSPGGQRLYSASDLEKLRLLRRVVEGGHRIAAVAGLDIQRLAQLASDAAEPKGSMAGADVEATGILDELLDAVTTLDAATLDARLRRAVMTLGTQSWVTAVVGPLLAAIGDRWHAGEISTAQEHLASTAIREVLAWVIRAFGTPDSAPAIVIATPTGEMHELGAMMAGVAAAEAGWRVQYLGPNLPAAELAKVSLQLGAKAVAISFVYRDDKATALADILQLRAKLPARVPLFVGGAAASSNAKALGKSGIFIVHDGMDLRAELSAIMPSS